MATWTIDGPRRIDLDDVARLHVRLLGGRLNVVGGDAPARLEVTRVERRPLTVTHDAGLLQVGYDPEAFETSWYRRLLRPGRQPKRADVTVVVPRRCAVDVLAVSAPVVVSGVRAPVTVRTIGSSITLADLPSYAYAESVSGGVEARGPSGELWVNTVSGAVTLVEGCGAVHAETVSGSVTLDLAVAGEDEDVRVTTVSGAVRMRLPADADAVARLHSISGEVTTAFPELRYDGLPGMRLWHGRIGGGAGRVWAKTTSGRITLLRGQPAGADAGEGAVRREPDGPGSAGGG
jgi:hypothetical protein